MPELNYNNGDVTFRPNWGAIWAGTFTFIGIWSVFGLLGEAIFATAASPNADNPVLGMSVGLGAWSIVLTVIAMYVGGRTVAHYARVENARDGALLGNIMFGLSVTAVLLLTVSGTIALNNGAGRASSSYVLYMFSDLGWIGFVSLFLGWLAAMGGAASIRRPAELAHPGAAVERMHHA